MKNKSKEKMKKQKNNNTAFMQFYNILDKIKLWQFLLLLGIISAILFSFTISPFMSVITDDCHYMNVARAIYTGQGYKTINIEPITTEKLVTPLYPLFLATCMKIAGHARPVILIKILLSIFYVIALITASFIFIRFFNVNRWIVFLFVLTSSINVFVVYFSSMILTQSPYILLTTLTILCFLYFDETNSRKYFVLATITTFLAIFVRFPGMPIFFTGFVWLLLKRKYKYAVVYGITIFLPSLLWFIWSLDSLGYKEQFIMDGVSNGGVLGTFMGIIHRTLRNLGRYFLIFIPQLLAMDPGIRVERYASPWNFVTMKQLLMAMVFIPLLIYTTLRRYLKKEIILPFLFIIIYFTSMSLPSSNMLRYATYLYFWIMLTIIIGFRDIFNRKNLSQKVQGIFVILFFSIQLYYIFPRYLKIAKIHTEHKRIYESPYTLPEELPLPGLFSAESRYWQVMKGYAWAYNNLPKSARIAGPLARSGAFYLERPIIFSIEHEKRLVNHNIEDEKELHRFVLNEADSLHNYLLDMETTHVIVNRASYPSIHIGVGLENFANCFILLKTSQAQDPNETVRIYELDTTCIRNNTQGINQDLKSIIETIAILVQSGDLQTAELLAKSRPSYFNEKEMMRKLYRYYAEKEDTEMMNKIQVAAKILYP